MRTPAFRWLAVGALGFAVACGLAVVWLRTRPEPLGRVDRPTPSAQSARPSVHPPDQMRGPGVPPTERLGAPADPAGVPPPLPSGPSPLPGPRPGTLGERSPAPTGTLRARTPGQVPSALQQAFERVDAAVLTCFGDVEARHPPPQRAEIAFRVAPLPDGGAVTTAEVVARTIQDPWLEACLVDAVRDSDLPPTERAPVERTRTYDYLPADPPPMR